MKQALIFGILPLNLNTNHIINGDFESPQIYPNTMVMYNSPGIVPGWDGRFEIKNKYYPSPMVSTQFIDLTEYEINGEITQTVELSVTGTYILSMKVKADSLQFSSYKAIVYWRGV